MKSRSRWFALTALALAFGCDDSQNPTGPKAVSPERADIILDGAHGGNPDFWFLPPMVPSPFGHPDFELGKFNNALQPSLRIEICELRNEHLSALGIPTGQTRCKADPIKPSIDAPPIKIFGAGTANPVNLVNLPLRQRGWWSLFGLPDDGFYYVLWNTRQSNLRTDKYYRIKVLIPGRAGDPPVVLGVADVDPMSSLSQWRHTRTGEVVQMIDDILLPIPFRVEQGALCERDELCTSVTVGNDNDGVEDVVSLPGPGGIGAIAAAGFPDVIRPPGEAPFVLTITQIRTTGAGFASNAVNRARQGTGATLCHPALNLQQFEGCFNFSTIPELSPLNEAGDQFLDFVRVAVCFELADTEDPRLPFIQLYASDVNEPPRALPSASDVGLLGPDARNCGDPSPIGFNSSKGVMGLASAGWQKIKGGLGRLFSVNTAYALDVGLGGLVKRFSNIGPALNAEIRFDSEASKDVQVGQPTTFSVKIVGIPHHEGDSEAGLPNMPVVFTLGASETCGGGISGTEANSVGATTNADGVATVSLDVDSGTCTVTATTGKALGGAKTFTAIMPAVPNPVLAFTGSEVDGTFATYNLAVTNYAAYPADMFAASPALPPCGANTNSSRTWVEIHNAVTDARIYGFCAFGSPSNLQSIWFSLPLAAAAPSVYIKLVDRLANVTYTSNAVVTVAPAVLPDLVISSGTPVLSPAQITTSGGIVTLSATTVSNLGGSFTLAGGVRFGVYLSTDAVITAGDQLVGSANIPPGSLESGGTFNLPFPTGNIPAGVAAGNYFIGFLIDDNSAVAESNEGNNFVSAPFTIVSPLRMLSMQTGATIQFSANPPAEIATWASSAPTKVAVSAIGQVVATVGGENNNGGDGATLTSVLTTGAAGPTWLVNTPFTIFPRVTTAVWAPVQGAASYDVVVEHGNGCSGYANCELWTASGGANGIAGSSSSFTFEFVGTQPGRWRVTPRDVTGAIMPGQSTPYIFFRYIDGQ